MFSEVAERNRTALQKSLAEMSSSQLSVVTEAMNIAKSRAHHDEDIQFVRKLAVVNDMETLEIICHSAEALDPSIPLCNALRGF